MRNLTHPIPRIIRSNVYISTANNAHRIPNAPKLTPTPIPTFLPNSSFPGVGTPLAPDELLLIVDGIEFVGDDIEEKDV
jgi:hypothetical protein